MPVRRSSALDRQEVRDLEAVARRLWAQQLLLGGSLGADAIERSVGVVVLTRRRVFGLVAKLPEWPGGGAVVWGAVGRHPRSCFWLQGARVRWRICRGRYQRMRRGRHLDTFRYALSQGRPCATSRLPRATRRALLPALLAFEATGQVADHGFLGDEGVRLNCHVP